MSFDGSAIGGGKTSCLAGHLQFDRPWHSCCLLSGCIDNRTSTLVRLMTQSAQPDRSLPDKSNALFGAECTNEFPPDASGQNVGFDEVNESESVEPQEQLFANNQIFCFHCNRLESHFHSLKPFQRFPFYVGLSLGLIYLYGPFTCRCCGHRRRFRFDWLHPILIWRRWFVG